MSAWCGPRTSNPVVGVDPSMVGSIPTYSRHTIFKGFIAIQSDIINYRQLT